MLKKIGLLSLSLMWVSISYALNFPKVVVYFASWSIYRNPPPGSPPDATLKPHTIRGDTITHINYAFLKPMTANQILALDPADFDPNNDNYVPTLRRMLTDPWADTDYPGMQPSPAVPYQGNFGELAWLKQQYPHLKIGISAGGWTYSDNFSDIVANKLARSRFVQLLVNFADYYNFDAIDIDWEYPGYADHSGKPADKQNFTQFMQELYTACKEHSPELAISFATAAGGQNSNLNFLELNKLASTVDWINIFGYDFYGPWPGLEVTGHQAPLYAQKVASVLDNINGEVRSYIAGGMPASKIVLGMPLYSRTFAGVDSTTDGLFAPYQGPGPGTYEQGILTFYTLPTYDPKTGKASGGLLDQGYTRYWDSTSMVPYLYNPKLKIFVTYDDLQSLYLKADYARSMQLAGAMFWEADWNVWDTVGAVRSRLMLAGR